MCSIGRATLIYDSRSGFRELATGGGRVSRTAARIFSWGARALYLGPAFNLSPHRNSVAVLAVALDAPFNVAIDPANAQAGYVNCRSLVVPPNTLHHFADTSGAMAFLYVDACSRDLDRLSGQAGLRTPRAAFHLACEDALIARLRALCAGETVWAEARPDLCKDLGITGERHVDARVQRALNLLHASPWVRQPLTELAAEIGLSTSRFLHLFKEATGVPLRRYKLWVAMGAAMRSLAKGDNLTSAAMNGGFASSAHFSATFRQMFGLEPSRLARGQLTRHAGRS